MSPKAVIFDLDSTLSMSKQPIEPVMGEALKDLLERLPVAVMSGADFPQYETQLLPHLPEGSRLDRLFLFPTSAAECLAFQDNYWQKAYALSFSVQDKREINQALSDALAETKVAENEPLFGERIEDRGEQITFSGLGQDAPLDLKEKWDPDQEKRKALQAILSERLPRFAVNIGGTTSIDITRKGIDKAYGIRWLSHRLGIKPEEMLFVGDALYEGGNDAAAIKTGINVQSVTGPHETLEIIRKVLATL